MGYPMFNPPRQATNHDSFLRKLGLTVVTALVLGVMTWVGVGVQNLINSTHALHETSAINTLKIEQIQSTLQPLPTLTEQIALLRYDVNDLKQRQEKDDEFRESHSAKVPPKWTH